MKNLLTLVFVCITAAAPAFALQAQKGEPDACAAPDPITAPEPGYKQGEIKKQPKDTADLPSVIQTVEQALRCYQWVSEDKDPLQPKGLPKLSSADLDFKTTSGATVGFSFSMFVFKVGGSRERDVTNEIKFTYSVPKPKAGADRNFHKKGPVPLYAELVKDVAAAARAAQAQSTALNMPLSKVSISISYGIKFDGNVSINVPVELVTIGGNGDYNKNNTQTITLTFGQ